MERYEVCVSFYLDAESPEDASNIVEGLLIIDQSHEENNIDFVVSNAIEDF